ncbi:Leucine-rich repeat domain, L domain-like [Phytophthora cactorum]|nr:Leucine-rich repeat domain, L domain-like [Phytophthora cactorum]
MSRRQSRESKRTALRLPMSTHRDDHVVDTNLEENLSWRSECHRASPTQTREGSLFPHRAEEVARSDWRRRYQGEITAISSCFQSKSEIAREHYRVCFVELRDIRALVLVSQDLNILHLRTLSKNLFLFSSLQSVNLSDNQLDDSGSKEIREDIA